MTDTADEVEPPVSSNDDVRISGSVGDGPIIGAAMRVLAADGSELAAFTSDSTADFDITVQAGPGTFPLTVVAQGGTDLVTNLPPDFDLRGLVFDPGNPAIANTNPYSTLAIETARDLPGGLSAGNVRLAETTATTVLNFGLTSLVGTGPMGTPIDDANVTEIVKASEALGELVRRTRDWLGVAGETVNGDVVAGRLGADLVDAVLDGRGGARADRRTAAIAVLVAAQISLETAANELHVNGVDATAALDTAINQVSAGSPQALSDLTATAAMLEQIRRGLAAATAVGDTRIDSLRTIAAGLQPGLDAMLIRGLLPADYRQILADTVNAVATGDDALIDSVNTISRTGEPNPPGNQTPIISGTPSPNVQVDMPYAFTPTASDADGDTLTFSVVNAPSWATFDTTTGAITGTPGIGDVNTYPNIIITVTDGQASASLSPFSITVTMQPNINQPPTISGTPTTTVSANTPYAFTPTSSDADGDTLSFSVANLPSWAAFDTSTGAITGTPGVGDVNTYPGIIITVTDGQASASLGPFSITVQAVSVGSVTLSWTPPTQNNDGSPLTDLAGFRIYWGQNGDYPNSVTLDNPGLTTYVLENIPTGTWQFVSTAYTTQGVESNFSSVATRVVQ